MNDPTQPPASAGTADPPVEYDLPVTPDPNYYVELVAA